MKFIQTIRDYISKGTRAERADTTLTTSYVSAGEIDVRHFKSVKIYNKWTKNNATTALMKITELHTSGGQEHQQGDYTNVAGALSEESFETTYTVTGNKVPYAMDVTDVSYIKIYFKSAGGTADSKMKSDCIDSNAI